MERLIALSGLTTAEMTEILGFIMGFIMASVVAGHIIAWFLKAAFEMVCELIGLIACRVMKHIREKKNR